MLDPAIAAAVVASWIRRSFEAGLAAGRTEAVDETPVVQQVRAEARSLTRRLTTARAARAQVYRWWRDATTERDEVRDDVEQLVDELAAAAAEAALVVDDDTADPRVGLRTLLARIEQTVGPLTEGGRR
jgi:phosphoglycolate phosphatase-like HAD superfamily hydrolase